MRGRMAMIGTLAVYLIITTGCAKTATRKITHNQAIRLGTERRPQSRIKLPSGKAGTLRGEASAGLPNRYLSYRGKRYEERQLPGSQKEQDAAMKVILDELVDTGDRVDAGAGYGLRPSEHVYTRVGQSADEEIWFVDEATSTFDPDRNVWVHLQRWASKFTPVR